MEKRKQRRTRKRLACELVIGESRESVLVRDLSPEGLFVQTRAKLEPDARVRLVFAAQPDLPGVELEARVARKRSTPPRLQSSVPSGVGLVLIDPPAAYLTLVERSASSGVPEAEAPRDDAAAGAGLRTFRVRMIQPGRASANVFTVRSESMQGARARAIARAGRDWKIADIQEI
ncbi:MAG TPA: PilZ domain-containing protein [Myxococcota bacterium]|nr:PilZ domain-containing protein [Myxococcota bacterium]